MSQFCISCGAENQNEAKFCKSCGQKLKTQEEYEFDIKEKSSYSGNNTHRNHQDLFIEDGNFSLFSFSGCISRKTYWAVSFATVAIPLIVVFIVIVVAIVYSTELNFDPRSIDKESLVFIFIIPTFLWLWIGFVTSIKRLRDANFSAWLYLINIIPYLGTLIILVLNGFFPSVEEGNKYCKSKNNLSSKAIKWAYSLSIVPVILIVVAIILSKLTDNNENVNDVLANIPIEKEIINTAREIPTNVLTDKDTPHIRMETYTTDQNRYVKLISNKKSCIVEYNHLWNNGVEMTNCLNYKSKDNEQMLCTEEDNCIKRDEVNYFLVSGKKFQENYDKYITPFIGEKTFNFDGGSGTGQSIEITNNAIVTIMLHGIYSSSIIYQGKYKNLTKESPYMLIEDVLCYKEPGFEMQCTKL
jgi:uncharacterized membrane protein YhaH (DUF805 family)